MNEAEIEKKVKEILAKRLTVSVETISIDSKLVDDLGMDSFGAIEIIFELENAFDLKIAEDAVKEMEIVKDIINFIKNEKEQ